MRVVKKYFNPSQYYTSAKIRELNDLFIRGIVARYLYNYI